MITIWYRWIWFWLFFGYNVMVWHILSEKISVKVLDWSVQMNYCGKDISVPINIYSLHSNLWLISASNVWQRRFYFFFSALVPDKWVEFKLQDTARVSQNTHLYRYISFMANHEFGCILNISPYFVECNNLCLSIV